MLMQFRNKCKPGEEMTTVGEEHPQENKKQNADGAAMQEADQISALSETLTKERWQQDAQVAGKHACQWEKFMSRWTGDNRHDDAPSRECSEDKNCYILAVKLAKLTEDTNRES